MNAPSTAAESPALFESATRLTATSPSSRDVRLAHLLHCVACGDPGAFRELHARSVRTLRPVALRLLRDPGRAEDALQEAYVSIWRHAADYSPARSGPLTWMSAIVRNRCLTLLRVTRDTVRLVSPGARWDEEDASPFEEESELWTDASHPGGTDGQALWSALDALPGRYRQALVLACIDELSHAEVADRLRVPLGTAKTWIRRGLEALRFLVADQ